MNKDTRRLFKHLLICQYTKWIGNDDTLSLKIDARTSGLHINIDRKGGFEVRRLKDNNSFLVDNTKDPAKTGIAKNQHNLDVELVKNLFQYAKERGKVDYTDDITYLIERLR